MPFAPVTILETLTLGDVLEDVLHRLQTVHRLHIHVAAVPVEEDGVVRHHPLVGHPPSSSGEHDPSPLCWRTPPVPRVLLLQLDRGLLKLLWVPLGAFPVCPSPDHAGRVWTILPARAVYHVLLNQTGELWMRMLVWHLRRHHTVHVLGGVRLVFIGHEQQQVDVRKSCEKDSVCKWE